METVLNRSHLESVHHYGTAAIRRLQDKRHARENFPMCLRGSCEAVAALHELIDELLDAAV